MNKNKNLFLQLEDNIFIKFWFGDNNQIYIAGKGYITFKAKNGKIMYMHNTLYVMGLKHNILRIGQMFFNKYMLVFKKRSCIITNETNKQVIATILLYKNRMYMLKMQPNTIKCLKSILELDYLWHKSFENINFNSLKEIKKLVKGIPTFSHPLDSLCESYISRKYHREKFPHH